MADVNDAPKPSVAPSVAPTVAPKAAAPKAPEGKGGMHTVFSGDGESTVFTGADADAARAGKVK